MSLYYPFFISQVKLDFMKNNSQDGQYNSQYLKKFTVGLIHTSRSRVNSRIYIQFTWSFTTVTKTVLNVAFIVNELFQDVFFVSFNFLPSLK